LEAIGKASRILEPSLPSWSMSINLAISVRRATSGARPAPPRPRAEFFSNALQTDEFDQENLEYFIRSRLSFYTY
jgi:hypothetical protein